MTRTDVRTLSVACLTLLVAMAGCLGGPGAGGQTTTAGDAQTPADSQPRTDREQTDPTVTTTGRQQRPETGTPTLTGGDGNGLPESALGEHVDRLQSAGSFTVVASTRSRSNTSEPETANWTMAVNLTTGESHLHGTSVIRGQSIPFQMYSPPDTNTTYVRRTIGNRSSVRERETGEGRYFLLEGAALFDSVSLAREGTATVDGETYRRYTADGPDAVTDEAYFDGTVESFHMTVLLDPDTGLIRRVSYEYTVTRDGEHSSTTTRFQYVDVGSTEVERPDWMSEVDG